jgi:DNA-binding CsgD family transcriptional regulator
MQLGPIDVIEAAYAMDSSDSAWLESICKITEAQLGRNTGLIGFPYRIVDDGTLSGGETICIGIAPELQTVTAQLIRSLPPEYVRETYAKVPCCTASHAGDQQVREATRAAAQRFFYVYGWKDFLVVNALDPTGHGIYMGMPLPEETSLPSRVKTVWSRLAIHIAAGYRLRRRLASAGAEPAEAILTPSGKIEHAEPESQSSAMQTSLREAVRTIERTRGSMRRKEPERAVAEWQGLIAARWTLLEHFESDGKRYLLARRNEPQLRLGFAAVTERERQALGYAALGHTNKLIAYEMGVTPATVGVLLHRAAAKLGTRSRAELIAAYRKHVSLPDPQSSR